MSKSKGKTSEIAWHLIDAKGLVLGRLSTRAAGLLMGKDRLDSAPNLVSPVKVVVINTDHVAVTGNKEEQKMYRYYTGYPGGLKERNLAAQRKKDSTKIVLSAIAGMLPKNRLRDKRLSNLKLYVGPEHPHGAQMKNSK